MNKLIGPSDVAETIKDFYEERFGGKEKGRYQITRKLFKEMTDRMILTDDYLIELKELLYEEGFTLIDLEGDSYVVMPTRILQGYRKLTSAMVHNFISGGELDDAEKNNQDPAG